MQNSMHVKMEYPEAVLFKKENLLIEKSILEAISHLREYENLRKKEFIIKNEIRRNINSLFHLIVSLQSDLPKGNIQFESEKNINEIKHVSKNREMKRSINRELEKELNEIRQKLARLE